MVNHPNRGTAKALSLTDTERRLLLQLINIMEAGEWSAGDYCLTQRQFDVLQQAKAKLKG